MAASHFYSGYLLALDSICRFVYARDFGYETLGWSDIRGLSQKSDDGLLNILGWASGKVDLDPTIDNSLVNRNPTLQSGFFCVWEHCIH